MSIDLLVPTRARPRNIHRLVESIEDTAAFPESLAMYFYVDEDDDVTRQNIDSIRAAHPLIETHFAVGPRIPLSLIYTGMSAESKGDILWSGGDDIVFRTPGWDKMVEEEFANVADRILLVYGNDCLQQHRLATHSFISRKSVEILGYFYPNTGEIAVTDIWLHHAYQVINRLHYRPDIVTEHMHWLRRDADGNPLAEYDETYAGQYEHNYPEVMATLQAHQDHLVRGINTLAKAAGDSQRLYPKHPTSVPQIA